MKNHIAAAIALAASTFAPFANAATFVYTFNDMTWVPNQAKDSFNVARYYENRGPNRWGTVWGTPMTFTTTFPPSSAYSHFHIGFKGQEQCYHNATATMGKYVNNVCTPLDVWSNRGPFSTHDFSQALFFQVVTDASVMVPFVVKKIDVYMPGDQSITLYVRKTDGGWFQWSPLHGHLTGTPNYFRWTLNSGYTGKFQAMAWKSVSGAGYPSTVGRVEITD